MNRSLPAFATVLLLLTSCATLRIDVDVYKGPLANEESVELQELIALAIGAKPLVVQLRDAADATARSQSECVWRQESMDSKYQSTWMDPGDLRRTPTFISPLARNANEVLGLYDDDSSHELDPDLRRVRDDLDSYSDALGIINRTSPQEIRLEDRILAQLDALPPQNSDAFNRNLAALRSYFTLDARGYRDAKAVGLAMLANHIELATKDPRTGERVTWDLQTASTAPWGANAWYAALESKEVWVKFIEAAKAAMAWSPELGRDIAIAGPDIASSFGIARDMLRRVMRRSAEFAQRESLAAQQSHKWSTAARSALDLAVLASASEFMKELVRTPIHDLELGPQQSRLSELLQAVSQLPAGEKDALFAPRKQRTPETQSRLSRFLDLLSEKTARPVEECVLWLADALLEADLWLQSKGAEHLRTQSTDPKLASSYLGLFRIEFMYGLAAGPVRLDSTDTANGGLADVEFLRSELHALSHAGLRGGRLAQGIETLVTQYLEKQKRGDGDLREMERALLMELIRFGEKLRVLSGFQNLVDSNGTQNYMDVLQAIANSILTQADALQRSRGVLDGEREKEESVLARNARETTMEMLSRMEGTKRADIVELRMPAATEGRSAREVLLEYATRLKYMIATELANGGETTRLKNLRLAAAYIDEKMTELTRLRLAAAYLRNAYPAPDLQQTPLHLVPGILHGDQSLSNDRVDVAAQLDKQFWQNVNHIALRGVGSTNYVVAKDDIGNWQVKAYAADTSRIMSSLANLATFVSQAGLSPAAIAGAAELRKLVDKTRRGTALTETENTRMKELGQQREAASAKRKAQQGVLSAAVKQATELNAELRQHLAATLPKTDPQKSPVDDVKVATLVDTDPKANLTALEAEFVALFKLETDATRLAALKSFRQRRLDLLRGLQLQLLESMSTPKP
ncbi:MAG: hypothetical protein U1F36_23770 [Planctomycetota bacterium]